MARRARADRSALVSFCMRAAPPRAPASFVFISELYQAVGRSVVDNAFVPSARYDRIHVSRRLSINTTHMLDQQEIEMYRSRAFDKKRGSVFEAVAFAFLIGFALVVAAAFYGA